MKILRAIAWFLLLPFVVGCFVSLRAALDPQTGRSLLVALGGFTAAVGALSALGFGISALSFRRQRR
jgi:hypothetical protein